MELPSLTLAHPSGARAEVYLQGAHVARWTDAAGEDLLFLSRESRFESGVPIRGGVPVVFPQFADRGPLPKHGFARTTPWEVVEEGTDAEGAAFALLRLTDTPSTRELWPRPFRVELRVSLDAALTLELRVVNPGEESMEFTCALHTYLRVGDVRRAAVEGLRGVTYVDKVYNGAARVEEREEVAIRGEVDRIYRHAPDRLGVRDPARGRRLVVAQEGFADTVVWNPGEALARRLPDLGDEEYREMLCVEAANAATPVRLEPGAEWRGVQRLRPE
jgi:glucose-6-phosphate 1-epimerase